jgi:hypothetical protein
MALMEFHEEIGGEEKAAKERNVAWIQPMHPLYIPFICQRPSVQIPP